MPVIRLKPGEMAASVTPKKKRVTIIPVKSCVVAWHASTTPQRKLKPWSILLIIKRLYREAEAHSVVARTFAIGSRTMSMEAGYENTRYEK